MSSTDAAPSTFHCAACETRALSARIEYDELGYAVCPTCGGSTRPLGFSRGEWSWGAEYVDGE